MSARPRHRDRRGLERLRIRHMKTRGPLCAIDLVWSSPEEALLAYARAGCVEAMRELIDKNTNVCARFLSEALVIAETESRLAHPTIKSAYVATIEALLEAGAPASALLSDMADVLPTLQARSLDAALPTTNTPARVRL